MADVHEVTGAWRGRWALWGALVLAVAVGFGLWLLHHQALDAELRMLDSLAAAMAAQADGTLDVAGGALRATRDALRTGQLVPGSASAQAMLHARTPALPQFQALVVVDRQGRLLASSEPGALPAGLLAWLDEVAPAHQAPAHADEVVVSSPHAGGWHGQTSIGVSMPWHNLQGEVQGWVVLLVGAEFLDGRFRQIAPAADVALAIYRQGRGLVSDGPGDGSAHLLPAALLDSLWARPGLVPPALATLPEGQQRLVAARMLQRHALMVLITRDASAALSEWQLQAWLVSGLTCLGVCVTWWLVLRNRREHRLRQASEAALAQEQERAVRAFQAAREGHWEWNPGSQRSYMSPRMRELMGEARSDPVLRTPALWECPLLHPQDVDVLHQAFGLDGQGPLAALDCTFRVLASAEPRVWRYVHARGHAWYDERGQVQLVSGTAVDVSQEMQARRQRQQLEQQLQRARKLEALGTLAGGVAHDFNNILASVTGYAELARDSVADASPLARQLDQVLHAAQRGKALVERILSFSRGHARQHTVFWLQPVVEQTLHALQAQVPERVRLHSRLEAPDVAITGEPTLVDEALTNLCINAVQAMPGPGTLTVSLRPCTLEAPLALFEVTLVPGDYVCLSVEDSGVGIAPEVLPRLFDPFFTTRRQQKGTGLGLAVVHGAVVDLGGGIDVRSEPGRGACFTLYLPRAQVQPTALPDEGPAHSAPWLGDGQVVLVVDDEPELVLLAEELLAGLGYEPFGVTDARQALTCIQQEPQRFDVVLTDEMMPGLSGTALATALRALPVCPPIVLASGYGGPQLEQRALAAGVSQVLRKPFTREELAHAVGLALQPHRDTSFSCNKDAGGGRGSAT